MIDRPKVEQAVRLFLEAIGEDPDREGLRETPARVASMCQEIFYGLWEDPQVHLQIVISEEHDEMILVKDIPFYAICEHHLLPFFGKAHVAYIPRHNKLTGLSKLARVVAGFSTRPQIQERLTTQIADTINTKLNPMGVLVVIEAEHMCMTMRGVKKPGSKTITSAVRGVFRKNTVTRTEALALIKDK